MNSPISIILGVFLILPALVEAQSDKIYTYDDSRRLVAEVDSAGNRTVYTYDGEGKVLTLARSEPQPLSREGSLGLGPGNRGQGTTSLQEGTIIRVPGDFPTIQQAINGAANGDTILVAPGTYNERISFRGLAITVTSEEGPEVTLINATLGGSVVMFVSGEAPTSVLRGFTLLNGSASDGGGIRIQDSSPTVTGNIITNNRATSDGGGISIRGLSSATIRDNTITNNRSTFEGAGISIQNSSPTITGNVITNNQGCSGIGIGIGFGSPMVQGNIITDNTRVGCSGGIGGGGISVRGAARAQILDNFISNNIITSGNGGGITLFAAGTPTIRGNVISGNSASGISPCDQGGGIWIVNLSDALIVQNLITGNRAACGGGIFWLVPSGARGPLLVNNTIADNDSPRGSGIFADGFDARTELINNIIVARSGQAAVLCGDFSDLNPPIFRFNNVFAPEGTAYGGICVDETGRNGNISEDPLFVDPSNHDYHLQAGSPSVDAGDNAAPELPDTDLDGNPRIVDGGAGKPVIDMGVYEFLPSQEGYGKESLDVPLGMQKNSVPDPCPP